MNLFARERQQDLTSAAQLAESGEDQSDDLLQAHVGIESETNLPVPDAPNRNAEAQLTALSLGAGRIVHACSEHAEFELADAALHSQQQPIVGATRVVDAIQINDTGLDQATELQQMVPVTPIACQSRGVETQHGADLTGTQPRYQAVEAGPGHHAAGRSAKVIIDDFDLRKSTTAGLLNQVVLPTLTLQVGLYLRLGGL